tara:strand:- start:774 stop:2213 length:1440 start_codon:yes stop_codon:yes gene_type:complete
MKVTIENKKGLNKDLKVFIDKKTISSYVDEKYEELKKSVTLRGFRPGKVPREILKKQFGEAIFGEVLDKVLKDTSTKALQENKIKPAGQPKIDLKTFGEDKDLEYIISVTELPKIDIKPLENIKFDEFKVKIDNRETEKRIQEIANTQKNFEEVDPAKVANEGDLVIFDYKATVDGNEFKGNEGKNTQLEIGKDLFIKGFDKQLLKVKKNDEVNVSVNLPDNFPEKELVGKQAIFLCKISAVKKPKKTIIDDDFAKNLGAKDLKDLRELISKQINEEYKNSLDSLSNRQILEELNKIKLDEIPENLIEQEVKILSHGMKDEEVNKNKKNLQKQAIKRIKTGLILNEFGEQSKINVTEQEMQMEIQKQLRMMPGQEKILQEYYQSNPTVLANLRGQLYEEKIIKEIKKKAKSKLKEITKEDADILLKEENEKYINENKDHNHDHDHSSDKKSSSSKNISSPKKSKSTEKKALKTKKVSKK